MTAGTLRPVSGRVAGRARYGDWVRLDGRLCQVIRTGLAFGEYRLRDVVTRQEFTSDLSDDRWEFRPAPNLVLVTTVDSRGNEWTWQMAGPPKWVTPKVIERTSKVRHIAKYGTGEPLEVELVNVEWITQEAS